MEVSCSLITSNRFLTLYITTVPILCLINMFEFRRDDQDANRDVCLPDVFNRTMESSICTLRNCDEIKCLYKNVHILFLS